METCEDHHPSFVLKGPGAVIDVCHTAVGDHVATCSDAGVVQVWGATGKSWQLLTSCKVAGHPEKLAWADAEFGAVLAIGTRAGQVAVLQGPSIGAPTWRLSDSRLQCGRGPICDLSFAPKQLGLLLAAASTDGCIYMHEGHGLIANPLQWTLQCKLKVMSGPCQCLCWRPFTAGTTPLLLVCSDDGAAVWCYQQATMTWKRAASLSPESDEAPAASLHWAPTLGRPMELVAASFGSAVGIYRLKGPPAAPDVSLVTRLRHPRGVWRLEFDKLGRSLACSLAAPPEVWLWLPELREGAWRLGGRMVGREGGGAGAGGALGGAARDGDYDDMLD